MTIVPDAKRRMFELLRAADWSTVGHDEVTADCVAYGPSTHRETGVAVTVGNTRAQQEFATLGAPSKSEAFEVDVTITFALGDDALDAETHAFRMLAVLARVLREHPRLEHPSSGDALPGVSAAALTGHEAETSAVSENGPIATVITATVTVTARI